VTPHPPRRTLEERGRRLIERLRAEFIERTKARRRSAERDRESEPDAWGQIPCLILSLPIAGLFVVAVILAVYKFAEWVTGWTTSAFGSPLSLGISGILAILAGAWIAMRIVTGKSAPGTTRAAKLLVLGPRPWACWEPPSYLRRSINSQRRRHSDGRRGLSRDKSEPSTEGYAVMTSAPVPD
jgi:hypothetical protein